MIIITGANGILGRGIVEALIARRPAEEIGVSVRDTEGARPLADRGVQVRRGDFAEPASLASAFAGGRIILIVSSNTRAGDTLEQHRAAIEAAVAAGAERILYTSHAGARSDSAFLPARNHAQTEALLASSGVPYTALRNGFYAVTPGFYLGSVEETGTIAVPADGPVAWTTQADLAQAAAAILAGEAQFDGPTPPLTVEETLTFDDISEIASELLGRPVTRETPGDEDFVSAAMAAGTPEGAARFSLGLFQAARHGDFSATDPTLGTLLGRRPTPLRDVLAATIPR